jgi:hypothetical protein
MKSLLFLLLLLLLVFLLFLLPSLTWGADWPPASFSLVSNFEGNVGDTLEVKLIVDVPPGNVPQFYRLGLSHSIGLVALDVVKTPNYPSCWNNLFVNYKGYRDANLIMLDGDSCQQDYWTGHIATLRFRVIMPGDSFVELVEVDSNLNYMFPTLAYKERDPADPNLCSNGPWAYATSPEDFNGEDSNHPCVALLNISSPLIITTDSTTDVLPVSRTTWTNIKSLYKE